MPELPEVETVRIGLVDHVVGRRITDVEVAHPRAVRRHPGGATDLIGRLTGKTVTAARRRGKFLWLEVSDATDDAALVVHLGMSGQMLISQRDAPDHTHLRIRAGLDGDPGHDPLGAELRFVDQRTFGGWHVDELVDDPFRPGEQVPASVAHIAPDPFDPGYDREVVVARMRAKHTEIKRALLDQTVISGVGNIYADEALWRAKLHGTRMTDTLAPKRIRELLDAATEVMAQALAVGGTSFDALYVNVNGQSGYFERSLNAYGREGQPCRRCGRVMRREQFMNRSSFSCPQCQRAPRRRPSS
ncbi:bifunctional DNA-formamidopyrimidine glycosylase/DNA-(apurinic or apyrimidinic site) lyase [Gordonia sp. NB41Y]|uniref:bifunctional DNA-formamidopyrimidine glycosylase/DNA-(apurinic or apyrimidinic site) lyase n=1 Tax=Gordonia sp. NB41Y TaxID=875808 RepID=UPI000346787F|nr:bifunctional DNA-formamidopyrimidine glycosylase/DNA-(apurinic or apyrimidinic site) lyase [Gordonia sp. NB41Y]EMP12822.2 5-hydroxymethyluracil DNA glycosylase [Gordonia sp. NB41Y]WLP91221.1 bifunctional DNA-formamidopyrimidine glycosylase/DNA-(apurinic or apyrimidinic site) lyase [Gordonia sp. NB41Y]